MKSLPSTVRFQLVPTSRLMERKVRSGLVTAWRLATSPTSTSPPLANATTEGVVRAPSALAMTVGSPPSRTATTELVVPRSIPTARAMWSSSTAGPGPAACVRWSCVRWSGRDLPSRAARRTLLSLRDSGRVPSPRATALAPTVFPVLRSLRRHGRVLVLVCVVGMVVVTAPVLVVPLLQWLGDLLTP